MRGGRHENSQQLDGRTAVQLVERASFQERPSLPTANGFPSDEILVAVFSSLMAKSHVTTTSHNRKNMPPKVPDPHTHTHTHTRTHAHTHTHTHTCAIPMLASLSEMSPSLCRDTPKVSLRPESPKGAP